MPKGTTNGEVLGTSLTTAFTVPTGKQLTWCRFWFLNLTTDDKKITLHYVPKSGSASTANKIIEQQASAVLKGGESQEYFDFPMLGEDATVQWKADATASIAARMAHQTEASS